MQKLIAVLLLSLINEAGFSLPKKTEHAANKRPFVFANVSKLARDSKFKSLNGQNITIIRVPAIDANNKPVAAKHRFYIQGGLHGNETETTKFVAWLANRVRTGESKLNQLPSEQVAFDFVPVANPDGAAIESRYNERKINLNRNFGHLWGISRENPGTAKFSEPETQAIKYLLDKNRYTAAVDVHGYINWLVAPSQPDQNASPAEVYKYDQWMTALKLEMERFDPTYRLKTAGGLGDGGAFEDYAYWQAGTKAFCLEMATAFRHAYRPINGGVEKVDLFESYEELIYRIFKHALEIDERDITISQN
jgi:hypothetical protein